MTPPANPTTPAAAAADQPATAVHDGRARRIPFLLMIGAELTHEADGVAVVAIDLRPDLLNNHGGGHGGVVMSLLDSAMANAALSKVNYEREVVTIDMHVAFMKPGAGRLAEPADHASLGSRCAFATMPRRLRRSGFCGCRLCSTLEAEARVHRASPRE